MDFIMDLSLSVKLRVKILLMITDRLNKGIILILILSISTPAVAMAFIERYVPYHGFPKVIINNKGIQFTNTMWAILCKTLGIKYRLFLAYYRGKRMEPWNVRTRLFSLIYARILHSPKII